MLRWCALLLVVFAASSTKGEDISAEFTCDFEEDSCGLVSQAGLSAQWVRKRLEIGGRTGYVMSLEAKGEKTQVGRLLSPFFDIDKEDIKGCLQFDLHMSGDGAVALHVEEQNDFGFQSIHSVTTTTPGWRSYKIPLTVNNFVQFIFEGHCRPSLGTSVMAVDNFAFRLEKCPE